MGSSLCNISVLQRYNTPVFTQHPFVYVNPKATLTSRFTAPPLRPAVLSPLPFPSLSTGWKRSTCSLQLNTIRSEQLPSSLEEASQHSPSPETHRSCLGAAPSPSVSGALRGCSARRGHWHPPKSTFYRHNQTTSTSRTRYTSKSMVLPV